KRKTEIIKTKADAVNQQLNSPLPFSGSVTTATPNQTIEQKTRHVASTVVSKNSIQKPEIVAVKRESDAKFNPFKENSRKKNPYAFYLMGAIGGLFSAGLFMAIRKRAVKISQWSSKNLALSRTIQVIGHTILGFGSFIAGSILFNHDMVVTPLASGIFTSVFLAAAAIYPVNIRGKAVLQSLYNRTKLTDLAIVVSGALICASLGNQVAQERFTASADHVIGFTPALNIFSNISSKADLIDEALFQVDTESGEKLSVGQIILLILIPVVFLCLTLALIILSCFIACDGSGPLAALVLVFGLALFIYLSILSVQGVRKMKGRRNPVVNDKK
ncbi:MAG: hypothetical protein NTV09_09380, partial [Bacteroidetes bacterium]|nr:hypothetical protein [Bacteroidota bacterium]